MRTPLLSAAALAGLAAALVAPGRADTAAGFTPLFNGKDQGGRDRWEAVRRQVEKPVGEWNQYEITCQGDTIKSVINGQHVNTGTHAEMTKGHILLQSEGAPVVFRNVEIKSLK